MISSHILDTHLGRPAHDVVIKLYDAQHNLLGHAQTNQDGRVSDFGLQSLPVGEYQLEFEIAAYFAAQNISDILSQSLYLFFHCSGKRALSHSPIN